MALELLLRENRSDWNLYVGDFNFSLQPVSIGLLSHLMMDPYTLHPLDININ